DRDASPNVTGTGIGILAGTGVVHHPALLLADALVADADPATTDRFQAGVFRDFQQAAGAFTGSDIDIDTRLTEGHQRGVAAAAWLVNRRGTKVFKADILLWHLQVGKNIAAERNHRRRTTNKNLAAGKIRAVLLQ